MTHKFVSVGELEDPEPPKPVPIGRPVRGLWAAVIRLALDDALDGDIYARFWFFDKRSSFHSDVIVAGLSASRVRSKLENMSQLLRTNQQPLTRNKENGNECYL